MVSLIFHGECLDCPVFAITNSAIMNGFILVHLSIYLHKILFQCRALLMEHMFKILLGFQVALPNLVFEAVLFPIPFSVLDITQFLLIDKKNLMQLTIFVFVVKKCYFFFLHHRFMFRKYYSYYLFQDNMKFLCYVT